MSNPEQPSDPSSGPIYVDPITGAPLQVDPATGQLSYGTGVTVPLPAAHPLPSTMPLPPAGLPTGFPTPQTSVGGPPPAPTGYPPFAAYPAGYPYQAMPGYTYPLAGFPAQGRNGLALASMIVSLCAICAGVIPALVGAILGHVARRQIRRTGQDGAGMALTGIIVGWAVVAIYAGLVAILVGTNWST